MTYAHKIGIGITTHNRPEVLLKTLKHIAKYMPEGARLVIVDDASDEYVGNRPEVRDLLPNGALLYRFPKNVGIATAKNRCLQTLENCEHIFLFDDDCYPRTKNWYVPYVESPEPHLMYLFKDLKHMRLRDTFMVYQDAKLVAMSHPRGCMVYFHRPVLDVAGGMDTGYARWGYEHGDLSNRIYNLGLTSFRFMDVPGSSRLFYSGDEEQTVDTTVPGTERSRYIARMRRRYDLSFSSTEYFPYKKSSKRKTPAKGKVPKRTVVMAAYFNGKPDPQRGTVWPTDYAALDVLRKSVTLKHDREMVIISNCFPAISKAGVVTHVKVPQGDNPYKQRWLSFWQYLRDNPDIKDVFLVDGTDVEMLNDPFPHMEEGVMYVGDEVVRLNSPWMRSTSRSSTIRKFLMREGNKPLLNCGVSGGSRETMMKLCRLMVEGLMVDQRTEYQDMSMFNYICRTMPPAKIEHGRKVTTVFKKNETESSAWFKHK